MSIVYDRQDRTLTLETCSTAYQMQIVSPGYLLHLYYGRRAEGCMDYLYLDHDCGFSPNPWERQDQRGWSLDTLPQEYPGSLGGDFRTPCLELSTDRGIRGADLRYVSHEICPRKYSLAPLPAAWAREGEAETLRITLADAASGLTAELLYAVYERQDVICRAVRLRNAGEQRIRLEKAASACLELPFGDWDWISFPGRHTMERQTLRRRVEEGRQSAGSLRGASSHQANPFVILCQPSAGEEQGDCFGLMSVYSGSHRIEVEKDQMGAVRCVAGIEPELFSWELGPGESFTAPEVILRFSHEGLGSLSRGFHRFLRENVCRGEWARRPRPVVLNSWEAAYFDVSEERILALAREARALDADLLVLDDGWFGDRRDDLRSLGDWSPNPERFPHGLGWLSEQVKALGLGFGLWLEPEMVSPRSELYQAHPDWALTMPGRPATLGRNQLVLDLGREEVQNWIFDTVAGLLRSAHIGYVKWDMNRELTDVYSHALPPERQGECVHRYYLGLYSLMERLTAAFPQVLFEGCAGGGGRFDAGILAWFPQIWTSDNTDPIARLSIQEGTSYGYPLSAMAAHVSASPNHQTGRRTPLGTRAMAAATGAFGYELDPGRLSGEERQEIRGQIARWRELEGLLREGELYRLSGPDAPCAAWQLVSPDGGESLLTVVMRSVESNPRPLWLRLRGLAEEGRYRLVWQERAGCLEELSALSEREYTGAALLCAGLTLPPLRGDYPTMRLLLRRTDHAGETRAAGEKE